MNVTIETRRHKIAGWALLGIFGLVVALFALAMGLMTANHKAEQQGMRMELNATESDSVSSTLYEIADKAATLVVGTDAKLIDVSHPEGDYELLRIIEPGGDVLEKRASLGNVHFFIYRNSTAFAFIRDDAGECLVLWKADEWNLASVNICGDKMAVDWKKEGDFNFHKELQDFKERKLTAYREI